MDTWEPSKEIDNHNFKITNSFVIFCLKETANELVLLFALPKRPLPILQIILLQVAVPWGEVRLLAKVDFCFWLYRLGMLQKNGKMQRKVMMSDESLRIRPHCLMHEISTALKWHCNTV